MEDSGASERIKLILFGGKGGVGKTTCASACAMQLSENGYKTLLLSTDPAHSLSDSMEFEIGDKITKIAFTNNLYAIEIDAEKLFVRFKEEYEEEMKNILTSTTYLDQDDISDLFSLSIPGLDEVMAFKEIINLMESEKYDYYILDTAPTGHALRLLALPELFDQWIKVLARMRYKYRYVISRFSGKDIEYIKDSSDDFLFNMKKTVQKIHSIFRNPEKSEFIIVMIPETMAILETQRLAHSLKRLGIPVRHIIVNRVASSEYGYCDFCNKKWLDQKKCLDEIVKEFTNYNIIHLLERPIQVKGLEMLKTLGFPQGWLKEIFGGIS